MPSIEEISSLVEEPEENSSEITPENDTTEQFPNKENIEQKIEKIKALEVENKKLNEEIQHSLDEQSKKYREFKIDRENLAQSEQNRLDPIEEQIEQSYMLELSTERAFNEDIRLMEKAKRVTINNQANQLIPLIKEFPYRKFPESPDKVFNINEDSDFETLATQIQFSMTANTTEEEIKSKLNKKITLVGPREEVQEKIQEICEKIIQIKKAHTQAIEKKEEEKHIQLDKQKQKRSELRLALGNIRQEYTNKRSELEFQREELIEKLREKRTEIRKQIKENEKEIENLRSK